MKLTIPAAGLFITVGIIILCGSTMVWLPFLTRMPGNSYQGPLPALTQEQTILSTELKHCVEQLAGAIGERNFVALNNLNAAADYIERSFARCGLPVQRQSYSVTGKTYYNIEAEKTGDHDPQKIIIIGAHYDSVLYSPGANDNASGVAALLALARRVATRQTTATIRFVAFSTEEPPFFWTANMGSYRYAQRSRERGENIVGMLALETIGCYFEEGGTQQYPFPLGLWYPAKGNFIAFVSNISSRSFLREIITAFRKHAAFPSEGGSFPWFIPGIFWSDHWSFWKMGYPAIMITDTAPFRYPYYHSGNDTPDKLDYDRLARVVNGLEQVIGELAGIH